MMDPNGHNERTQRLVGAENTEAPPSQMAKRGNDFQQCARQDSNL